MCSANIAAFVISPQSAVPLRGNRSRTQRLAAAPSHEQGHGRIQLDQVLFLGASIGSSNKLWLLDNEPISHSEVARFAFTAVANSRGKITLAWTDPAASPLADVALVNDLDLVSFFFFDLRYTWLLGTYQQRLLMSCNVRRLLCAKAATSAATLVCFRRSAVAIS